MSLSSQVDKAEERYRQARAKMVQSQLARRGISNQRVLDAMGKVPRHLFVPPYVRHMAYDDGPLPIGAGQTISQPYIVALMTQLLDPRRDDRVLEIGVGSGYQTAILAELVREVTGIERIPELAAQAEEQLRALGYQNIAIHVGDGSLGYPEKAPYDGILVAAAAPQVPEPLLAQLSEGGQLVIPVGDSFEQTLAYVRREGGKVHTRQVTPVRFVPLIGKWGFRRDWHDPDDLT